MAMGGGLSRIRAVALVGVVALAAGLLLPASAVADMGTTLHVDSSNAACNDGGSGAQAAPYCSLQVAVDAAGPGVTVELDGGTYGATTVRTSGADGAPLVITGQGYKSISQLDFVGVHDVTLTGIRLLTDTTVGIQDSSAVTLDRVQLGYDKHFTAPMVEVSGDSTGVVLSRDYFDAETGSAGVSGVQVDPGVEGTVVTTDRFFGSDYETAVGVDGASDTDVTSNTVFHFAHGVSVQDDAVGTVIENNWFSADDIQVDAGSAPLTRESYNNVVVYTQGALYDWAGTAYTSMSAFQAASGQGAHDIDTQVPWQRYDDDYPQEGSTTVDSADASAPGELATDYAGLPRVDDSTEPNTGTGVGYYDRGADELQDPFRSYSPRLVATAVAGYPATIVTDDDNPWGTPVTRTIDFGDGTAPATSTAASGSWKHTYAKAGSYTLTETENGITYEVGVYVQPFGPLSTTFAVQVPDPAHPLAVNIQGDPQTPFSLSACTVDFGDGTPTMQGIDACYAAPHTYAKPGTYTVTERVTDDDARTVTASHSAGVGPEFVPMPVTRVLDTRAGLGAAKKKIASGKVVRLKVNGTAGVADATSVMLDASVTGAAKSGYLTAYPDGSKRPRSSLFSYRTGQTVGNLLDVPVGSDGYVDLYVSAGPVDVVVSVEGYDTLTPGAKGTSLTNDAAIWGQFREVLDTRGVKNLLPKLGKVGAGKSVTFTALLPKVNNGDYYEYGAKAVLLAVTVRNATSSSWVTAYQPGTKVPAAEASIAKGDTRSFTVVADVDAKGRVSLYNHAGSVDLQASVEGFYYPLSADDTMTAVAGYTRNNPVHAVTPVRILDTRNGTGAHKRPIAQDADLTFQTAGVHGIPASATGVMLDVTATGPTASGALTLWGDASGQSSASALSFPKGGTRSVLVYLPLKHGKAGIYNGSNGTVNVFADVVGYSVN
jgi:hypothetical protein